MTMVYTGSKSMTAPKISPKMFITMEVFSGDTAYCVQMCEVGDAVGNKPQRKKDGQNPVPDHRVSDQDHSRHDAEYTGDKGNNGGEAGIALSLYIK